MFVLPEVLPESVGELDTLAARAQAEVSVLSARHAAFRAGSGESLSGEDVERLAALVDGLDRIGVAREAALTAVAGRGGRPVEFTNLGGGAGDLPARQDVGWQMARSAPGYRSGRVGFAEIAQSFHDLRTVGRRPAGKVIGALAGETLATIARELPPVEDPRGLVAAIEHATREIPGKGKPTAEALTAAGGWCSPSEQLYDFCDVPDATDLVSVPEISVTRGGVRWPVEPDLSVLLTDEAFEFFFTESELEGLDEDGNPTAVKECVEVPCPDAYEDMRLSVVGFCVEAGILADQAWPELTEWFLRKLIAAHLRSISKRTIADMVAGSTAVDYTGQPYIGAGGSVLNCLALAATNIRLNQGLAHNATIEGVAPTWLNEVIRSDLAYQHGTEVKAVTDAQIASWLTARHIALQYVADWQSRGIREPGWIAPEGVTTVWPTSVQVLLYPAGTWFRALQPVLELGALYPKEQLQVNRFTRFFTEDAIAVGKRCGVSLVAEVPVCPNGGIGDRYLIDCTTSAA
ncbi:major capsid protein [Mycolicibacterium sp. 050232]|uniref:major capsid protein n=1 Tax=Mycolicibacterium sp. 050232 TaxID=3113982 RepID=UPI002E2DB203|nr:major capsid protein [Mycolicibacterium sp. 050232]MED5812928.1 major capsid protein [Mycolicibacterium sp. 050232]